MKSQKLVLLAALSLTMSYSLTACSDDQSAEKSTGDAEQLSPKTAESSDITDQGKELWEQTKSTTGEVVDKGLEVGSTAMDKSKELYEKGK